MSKFAPHRKSYNNPRATTATVCQKCLKPGHFIYECKSERPYVSRPSRTEMLENPKVLAKLKADGKPSVEVPEEFKMKSGTANLILEAKEKERGKQRVGTDSPPRKKARRSSYSSSESSSDSESESDSASDTSDSSASDSDDSHSRSSSASSRSRDRKRRVPRRRDSRSRSTSRSRFSDSSSERD